MKRTETLVILSPGFPENEADSTCLPAQQALVRSLNRQFPEVQIVVVAFQYPFSAKEYTWQGNRVIPLNGRNRKRLYRLVTWVKCWQTLRSLYRQQRPMGILSFWLDECALLGQRFAQQRRIPHHTWLLGQDARPGNRYVKWMHPKPSSLAAISDSLARRFNSHYHIYPAHVIPNGIEPEEYPVSSGEKDIDLIGVGSLIPLKRFAVFVDVVKTLQHRIPGIQAVICGKGVEEPQLRQRIAENGLERNITLTGELSHREVLGLLQRSKVLLHPSSYEGFSGACLEALYAGAHVISFFPPQDAWIRHWYIAADENAMCERAFEILSSGEVDFSPVLPYRMSDTAARILHLFLEKPVADVE